MTKILLVDDEQSIRTVYTEYLNRVDDFKVETAEDGNDALLKIAQSKPDIVILDISLPEISGVDVLGIIKADPEFKKIPVVILTGSQDYTEINKCLGMGAASYITKGEKHDEIIDKIKMVIKLNQRIRN
ncbi:MAG TPA: response regulator [Thermodesulfobacteriota bacterium]|nr:response regulator [Thermodesulfobacteriota bacterium]